MATFRSPAITTSDELIFGQAPRPVTTRSGMVIGGGTVYPELNFTLATMPVNEATFGDIRSQYDKIAREALARAADLSAPGVVIEFETLPAMTDNPAWAADLCKVLLEAMADAQAETGLLSALRITPNDNRQTTGQDASQRSRHLDNMLNVFDLCAAAGAEFLSVESTGGKELHDQAILSGDIRKAIYALSVIATADMEMLWDRIVDIANRHDAIPAGDTACAFGNTSMVLADRKMLPRVFAAVDRAVTAIRSLVAHECGAIGPGKDCGYENPILKAITGMPMSMEGKSAACAHLSAIGNLPMAMADLWSNESVQNIKLLGGMAPTVSMEQLIYDCRLLNCASASGQTAALQLRDWLVAGDATLDPQAFILAPDNVIELSRTITAAPDHYRACRDVAIKAVDLLSNAHDDGRMELDSRELPWLERMDQTLKSMPDERTDFIEQMQAELTDEYIVTDVNA